VVLHGGGFQPRLNAGGAKAQSTGYGVYLSAGHGTATHAPGVCAAFAQGPGEIRI